MPGPGPLIVKDENEAHDIAVVLRQVMNMRGGAGIKLTKNPDGITISLMPQGTQSTPASASGNLFPVLLTADGGSNGTNKTTAPTRTYTVRDLNGNLIDTAVSPVIKGFRTLKVHVIDATEGIGYYDTSGTFILWDTNEGPDEQNCS